MTTPLQDQYFELSVQLGQYPSGNATLLIARLNSSCKQYNMGLITPDEFQRIIDKITIEISNMSFRIKVTPKYVTSPEDQALIDTPHYVGYSANPSFKGIDPMHSRVTRVTSEIIVFESIDAAEDFANVLRDRNKSHTYDVIHA